MHKIINFIPDIFDIQYTPRLQGEPYWYTMHYPEGGITDARVLRIGQFMVFWEYLKK